MGEKQRLQEVTIPSQENEQQDSAPKNNQQTHLLPFNYLGWLTFLFLFKQYFLHKNIITCKLRKLICDEFRLNDS